MFGTLLILVLVQLFFPVIRRIFYWIALAVCTLAIVIWRLLQAAPKTKKEAAMVKAAPKGLVGRRVEYEETADLTVRGTIKAVHEHLGRRRFFVQWDDGAPRSSFVHEGHPLLTIQP
jgi:hypothetical protein